MIHKKAAAVVLARVLMDVAAQERELITAQEGQTMLPALNDDEHAMVSSAPHIYEGGSTTL